jgi:hypothetical protein
MKYYVACKGNLKKLFVNTFERILNKWVGFITKAAIFRVRNKKDGVCAPSLLLIMLFVLLGFSFYRTNAIQNTIL